MIVALSLEVSENLSLILQYDTRIKISLNQVKSPATHEVGCKFAKFESNLPLSSAYRLNMQLVLHSRVSNQSLIAEIFSLLMKQSTYLVQ